MKQKEKKFKIMFVSRWFVSMLKTISTLGGWETKSIRDCEIKTSENYATRLFLNMIIIII